jgi:ATP/ADP translocase
MILYMMSLFRTYDIVYDIVQNRAKVLKDFLITTLVATEVISILKIWRVLPLAILVSLANVKIIQHIKTEYIFYSVVGFFVFFFSFFLVLYYFQTASPMNFCCKLELEISGLI